MALAGSAEFQETFGYDASALPGTIFSKVMGAFQELLERIQDNLHSYLWESFYSHAGSFARAMHYGVVRDERSPINMHDDLRKALVKVSSAIASVKPLLTPPVMDVVESKLLESLESFLYDRFILQNYYRDESIGQFKGDLMAIEETFKRLMPTQPVSLALTRSREAQRIIEMQPEARDHFAQAIKGDDLDEITDILTSLQLSVLPLGDCEKIIKLVRQ